MKLLLAEKVEDPSFRKHPETSLFGTGTLCPEQLREPAEFCRAASPTHLQSEACRRSQRHAIQESQGGGADHLQSAGSRANAVKPFSCHG